MSKDNNQKKRSSGERVGPFVENISEATAACLVTMVQGNLLVVTLGHWLVAAETGLIAGSLASATLLVWRRASPWMVAALLGVVTAVVDFLVHPGSFGPVFAEAVVTGLGAAVLSYAVGWMWRRWRARRGSEAGAVEGQ